MSQWEESQRSLHFLLPRQPDRPSVLTSFQIKRERKNTERVISQWRWINKDRRRWRVVLFLWSFSYDSTLRLGPRRERKRRGEVQKKEVMEKKRNWRNRLKKRGWVGADEKLVRRPTELRKRVKRRFNGNWGGSNAKIKRSCTLWNLLGLRGLGGLGGRRWKILQQRGVERKEICF